MQEQVKAKSRTTSRMVRKQLFLTIEQNQRLKALAAAHGKSEGELVRECLDALIAREQADEQDWKKAWMNAAGMWADYTGIEAKIARGRKSWRTRRKRVLSDIEG